MLGPGGEQHNLILTTGAGDTPVPPITSLQTFASIGVHGYIPFNRERHLGNRQTVEERRAAAPVGWQLHANRTSIQSPNSMGKKPVRSNKTTPPFTLCFADDLPQKRPFSGCSRREDQMDPNAASHTYIKFVFAAFNVIKFHKTH